MNNILEFFKILLESLFSRFDKKEPVKPKVEEKVEEKVKPVKPIEVLIEKPKEPKRTFEDALKFVLKWEGGYSNDPNDPGGETKFGISKRSYPNLDIKNLTLEQAKEIYFQNYWLKAGCDELTSPLDIIVFDTAVNMGVSRAKEFLDKCFSYNADENLGYHSWRDYLIRRIVFYAGLGTAKLYIRDWVNRVVDLYKNVT